MADNKMLQAILDGQTTIRKDIKEVKEVMNKRFGETNERVDKLGLQIARLEDDAPTIEEFDDLEKRVSKLEKKSASN